MADITISDLELAPAIADDMVFPVENTTDTYAATLAMLRRLINKTFVEVENADFNALTDDGFYQCTGTPTNSPVAGAINWTLQVSAESGVVVQRAFSLDDNFANLYIRRWNGVTWTAWLDVGKGALDNKANVSNTVTTDTEQTITGTKTFPLGVLRALKPVLLKEDDEKEGGQIYFERSSNSALKENPYIDLYTTEIRFVGVNSNNVVNVTLRVDLENNKVFVQNPEENSNDYQVPTTWWVNERLGLCMPDYSAVLSLSANSPAPSDGYVICRFDVGSGSTANLIIGNTEVMYLHSHNNYTGVSANFMVPILKGQSVARDTKFVPLKRR